MGHLAALLGGRGRRLRPRGRARRVLAALATAATVALFAVGTALADDPASGRAGIAAPADLSAPVVADDAAWSGGDGAHAVEPGAVAPPSCVCHDDGWCDCDDDVDDD